VKSRPLRIWIDLANTPHVLFFGPIVAELQRRGHSVTVTARRFANTFDVLDARGMKAKRLGRGHDASRNELLKQAHYLARTLRLMVFARRRFDVAASHLSYTQGEAARRLGMPLFGAIDYEHTRLEAFRSVRCLMVPSMVSDTAFERWGIPARVVRKYDGLKEHVYLASFRPMLDVRRYLDVAPDELLVTFRPIADHAHYGNGNGQAVQRMLLERLAAEKGARVLVLPRSRRQRREFECIARELPAVRVSRQAIDGPSLIDASDLVVTGGGTMLREAAVLGVPAVSCFSGSTGAVDRWLAGEGRAILVRNADDLGLVRLERRRRQSAPVVNGAVLSQIVQGICDAAGSS
jgi:predicted glycosyltransferase